ncbi:unnamed protein product [Cyclocybe aegerita]|uniref:Major facilitator superfamily (MFS) profile domain-containing protein n=1 Tax=Cyclocybe aegerita TaxID=1973307 RepID=A0A8S0WUQ6_CYCAE|nr:unnamed protein product [Cyclocybe aegerita]
MSVVGRYFSLFLLAFGPIASSITLVWVSNSIPRPPSKRAASIGVVNGFGNIGNLTSSFVWKASWGPEYQPTFIIGICSISAAILLAFIMRTILIRENHQLDLHEVGALKQARHERVQQAARLEGITLEEAMHKKRGFRYLY